MATMMSLWSGLSDHIGRRKALAIGLFGCTVLVMPMMILMKSGGCLWIAALAMFIATLSKPVIQSVGYLT